MARRQSRNHFDPYERAKLEIISARAARDRVLTDQREKSVADAVEWQHVFSEAPKKQSLMFLRENILTTIFNVRT